MCNAFTVHSSNELAHSVHFVFTLLDRKQAASSLNGKRKPSLDNNDINGALLSVWQGLIGLESKPEWNSHMHDPIAAGISKASIKTCANR